MRAFVSWSGKLSREVAKAIKEWLCQSVFPGESLDIFFSEEDIGAGSDWLKATMENLVSADCVIAVMTRENVHAPWLNFEAGAIASRCSDKNRVIPLLVDLDVADLKSPLTHYQSVGITKDGITKLIQDLKEFGGFASPSHIQDSIGRLHRELQTKVDQVLATIGETYIHNGFEIFPQHVKALKRGKVFIGVPMASADDEEYAEYKECALSVKDALIRYAGAKDVYCPSEEIPDRGKFDGYKKAIMKDFQILKESEHYVFIFPRSIASSILVEMGYAIALSKNTTIFARGENQLPFMLKKADMVIPNLEIYEYTNAEDIVNIIRREGDAFLVRGGK